MLKKISANRSLIPAKPEVKTQAAGKAPILDWINYNNKVIDGKDGGAKAVTASEHKVAKAVESNAYKYQSWVDQQKDVEVKKAPKMSATRSWQIIKDSMSKDELEEHYKEHPKERPVKLTPYKLDQGLDELYQGIVVDPKIEAAKQQYLKDEHARRIEKKRAAASGITNILNFYK